ncbi:UNVERIFIED_CONTAM: hypothetical protein Slati_1502500 [Sesamum latifolium]|uniref:Reverse transcriptase zinc-binding domain-containing protein n=1 Tax=Sesamum latifolium TaxID=2727402 RepID=A0AAW2X969_9LAMI
MIQSVLQAIPTYSMSCFKLPDTFLKEVEGKTEGGLGIRRLKEFNVALLCKQAWRITTTSNSLMHRMFKARYFSGILFAQAMGHGNVSRPATFQLVVPPRTLEGDVAVELLWILEEGGMRSWFGQNSTPWTSSGSFGNLRRRVEVDGMCPVCGLEEEGMEHILFDCTFARLVWALSDLPWGCAIRTGLEAEE